MMLGIAPRSSTAVEKTGLSLSGHSSDMNMAIPTLTGRATVEARNVTSRVPKRAGSAPKISATGSQVVPVTKSMRPNFFMAGSDS